MPENSRKYSVFIVQLFEKRYTRKIKLYITCMKLYNHVITINIKTGSCPAPCGL